MIWNRAFAALLVLATSACALPGSDFGQTPQIAPTAPQSAEVAGPGGQSAMAAVPAVPAGFRAVALAGGIDGPAGVAVDDLGSAYVIEGGNRLIRLGPGGGRDLVSQGATGAMWTGVAQSHGVLYVTASGAVEGGQLLRIDFSGRTNVVMSGLPVGDHSIQSPRVGPDGLVYVGVGTVTRSGIVDKDAPWRRTARNNHDIPCQDVTLSGHNAVEDHSQTGAFVPYGTPTKAGQIIAGQVPCTGSVLRTSQDGGAVQLVAWGFENPRGLAFTPEGRLYLLDDRGDGARAGTGEDQLFAVAPGVWYGWPDLAAAPSAKPLLATAPNPPPPALASFPAGVRATAFDVARADLFGGSVQAYIGLSAGRTAKVVRVNLRDGSSADFADFPGGSGVAALQFSPDGQILYVLDQAGTLWQIVRDIPIG